MTDGSLPTRLKPRRNRISESELLKRYKRWSEPLMLVLAAVSVPLFLLEHRYWPANVVGWMIVMGFAADLAVQVVLVDRSSRIRYLTQHWYDVAIVVLSVLPMLRSLRALRAAAWILRGMRVLIATHKAAKAFERNWQSLHGKSLLIFSVVLSAAAVMTVHQAESERVDSNIDSLQETLWWAAATVTTVGYGDLSPVTSLGRAAAVVLMMCGISLFGLLTANVSAKFLERDALIVYEQLAELAGTGASCPNCDHTPSVHTGTTTPTADNDTASRASEVDA